MSGSCRSSQPRPPSEKVSNSASCRMKAKRNDGNEWIGAKHAANVPTSFCLASTLCKKDMDSQLDLFAYPGSRICRFCQRLNHVRSPKKWCLILLLNGETTSMISELHNLEHDLEHDVEKHISDFLEKKHKEERNDPSRWSSISSSSSACLGARWVPYIQLNPAIRRWILTGKWWRIWANSWVITCYKPILGP